MESRNLDCNVCNIFADRVEDLVHQLAEEIGMSRRDLQISELKQPYAICPPATQHCMLGPDSPVHVHCCQPQENEARGCSASSSFEYEQSLKCVNISLAPCGTLDTKTFPDQGEYVQTQSNSQNDATSKQQALSVERDMNRRRQKHTGKKLKKTARQVMKDYIGMRMQHISGELM